MNERRQIGYGGLFGVAVAVGARRRLAGKGADQRPSGAGRRGSRRVPRRCHRRGERAKNGGNDKKNCATQFASQSAAARPNGRERSPSSGHDAPIRLARRWAAPRWSRSISCSSPSAFLLLPFGVKTDEEAGSPKVPGQADSAPHRFDLKRHLVRGGDPRRLLFALTMRIRPTAGSRRRPGLYHRASVSGASNA